MAELKDTKINGNLTITGNLNLPSSSKISSSVINYITDTELKNLEVQKDIKAKRFVLSGSIDESTNPTIYFRAGDDDTYMQDLFKRTILLESSKAYLIYKQKQDDDTYLQVALDFTNIATINKPINITVNDLINKDLLSGCWYRVIDYSISLIDDVLDSIKVADTPHYFDILVLATSKNTISPNAYAIKNSLDTTGYYDYSNLEKWKLEVTIIRDNNNYNHQFTRIYNANTLAITRMIDEFNNDIPYDFKNIVMKRYEILSDSSYTITDTMFTKGRYFTIETTHTGWEIDKDNPKWLYTFTYIDKYNNIEDFTIKYASINKFNYAKYTQFGNNKINLIYDFGFLFTFNHLMSCFVFSNNTGHEPITFSFSNLNNIYLNKIINSVGVTINQACVNLDTSTTFSKYCISFIPFTQNIIINSSPLTLNLENSINNKYIMNNSKKEIKIFNPADLV